MKVKQRFATLMELLIAMVLVSVLLAVLLSYYAQIEVVQSEVTQARLEGFQLRYLQMRLSSVIPYTIPVTGPVNESDKSKDFYFYTNSDETVAPELVFTYDNGIDIDPRFSNHVLGRLMLDQDQQRLFLLTWPVPRCWTKEEEPPPMKREVLIDKVTDIDFQFFYPPASQETTGSSIGGESKPAADQWHSRWNMSYQDLPAVVKVRVKRNVQTGFTPAGQWIEMAFPLPNARKPIVVMFP